MQHHPDMGRRALMQRAILIMAGSTIPVGAAARSPVRSGAGKALTPAQFKLCSAIADTIVPRTETPGAVDVGVPKLLDGLLRDWASPERRAALVGALDRIDAAARTQARKGFAELPPTERAALLKPHDAAALKAVPRTDGKKGLAAMMADASITDPGYGKLKELIVTLYYYSEPALTQELSYEHAPGQWLPSIPITPEIRPAGGPGLI